MTVGLAEFDATVRQQISAGLPLAHHPRVVPIIVDGAPYVVVRPRAGAGGRERFHHERRCLMAASKVSTVRGRAVADPPMRSHDDFSVFHDLTKRETAGDATVHTSLLRDWTDEHAAECGDILAALHGSAAPPMCRSLSERPMLLPLSVTQWSRTPDAVLATLRRLRTATTVAEVADLDAKARRDDVALGRTTMVHGDFKPDNLLIGADGAVRVIDWELAGSGSPVEDLAALFAGVALVAVQNRLLDVSAGEVEAVRDAIDIGTSRSVEYIRTALESYRATMPFDCSADRMLGAVVLRLLARAQGIATVSGTLTPLATVLCGLVDALCSDRRRSAAGLGAAFGLRGSA